MIGIIGGTHLLEKGVMSVVEEQDLNTPYGIAEVDFGKVCDADVALIRRHGRRSNKPPHTVPHAANLWALKLVGAEYVIGMSSVGCLRGSVKLPAIIIPDDYISFNDPSIHNDSLVHVTPGFDEDLRHTLIEFAKKSGYNVLENGVYFQTKGPRFETKAEIKLLKDYADCVGMTVGSEATLAKEAGLRYAAICTMDNYANGIRNETPDYAAVKAAAKENADVCIDIVSKAVKSLAMR